MDAPFGLMDGSFELTDDYFGLIERKNLLNNTLFHFCGQIQSVWDSIVDGEIGEKSKTPIINAVYQVLYKNKSPKKVFEKLMEKLD